MGRAGRAGRAYGACMVRKRVSYRGNVQGVGFRATARGVAQARPVTGWVKNEPDGTVTMEVQGSAEAVERVLEEVRGLMSGNIRGETVMAIGLVEGEGEFRVERH